MRGTRESTWLVVRRCLAMIRRAQRGVATRADLIRAVLELAGPDAYGGAEDEARQLRVEKDLERARQRLGVDLYHDRAQGGYVIRDAALPLLDLPAEDVETIAWLEETFDLGSPQHDQVHRFVARLRRWLSPQRSAEIDRCRTALTVNLRQRDQDQIDETVWTQLTTALLSRRRVQFDYTSPKHGDAAARRHVVDPYDRYFDTIRGHYYLKGWCHYSDGPLGRHAQHKYFYYRLGRIRAVQVLPTKLSPIPPPPRYQPVVYELSPQLARAGVTRHPQIEIDATEPQPDGAVIVRGRTDDVFWAVRALLHYGPGCRVIGGPSMRREMVRLVQEMGELYR